MKHTYAEVLELRKQPPRNLWHPDYMEAAVGEVNRLRIALETIMSYCRPNDLLSGALLTKCYHVTDEALAPRQLDETDCCDWVSLVFLVTWWRGNTKHEDTFLTLEEAVLHAAGHSDAIIHEIRRYQPAKMG